MPNILATAETLAQAGLRQLYQAVIALRGNPDDPTPPQATPTTVHPPEPAPQRSRVTRTKKTPAAGTKTASKQAQGRKKPAPSAPGPTNAELRAWARANNMTVADRGQISNTIRDAYAKAHA